MRQLIAASLVVVTIGVLQPVSVAAQPPQAGQISFEQFRMLSRGMTEGQVISKLGAPIAKTTISCAAEKSQATSRPRTCRN